MQNQCFRRWKWTNTVRNAKNFRNESQNWKGNYSNTRRKFPNANNSKISVAPPFSSKFPINSQHVQTGVYPPSDPSRIICLPLPVSNQIFFDFIRTNSRAVSNQRANEDIQ